MLVDWQLTRPMPPPKSAWLSLILQSLMPAKAPSMHTPPPQPAVLSSMTQSEINAFDASDRAIPPPRPRAVFSRIRQPVITSDDSPSVAMAAPLEAVLWMKVQFLSVGELFRQ
jgi:hypothetical protein